MTKQQILHKTINKIGQLEQPKINFFIGYWIGIIVGMLITLLIMGLFYGRYIGILPLIK